MKTHSPAPLYFLAIIVLLLMAFRPYQTSFEKISVQEFEILDKKGTKRASFTVDENGEIVFRMMDKTGTIRVKMSAGVDGSGMVLLDNNTNPGVHILAKNSGTSVAVIGADGKRKEIRNLFKPSLPLSTPFLLSN